MFIQQRWFYLYIRKPGLGELEMNKHGILAIRVAQSDVYFATGSVSKISKLVLCDWFCQFHQINLVYFSDITVKPDLTTTFLRNGFIFCKTNVNFLSKRLPPPSASDQPITGSFNLLKQSTMFSHLEFNTQ